VLIVFAQSAMLLLIDNYDSFVHNLARYFERLGQEARVVRNDAIDVSQLRQMRPGAVVLSPGPCTPQEAGASLEVVRELHSEMPILGVCLGHQVIAEALGGSVVHAPMPVHVQGSEIRHDGAGLFAGLPSPLTVGRYHSLLVEPSSLPDDLQPTAWTEDGVLMAFEHVRLPVYGVQFHPESILTDGGFEVLANFLRLAGLTTNGNANSVVMNELCQPAAPTALLPDRPVTF
jgi:anthranilate synthase/aminodeoxychorismate synthase-like glutamine amidotransferase